jgi:hypothetical protein
MRRAVLVLAVLLAAVAAGTARADGDPASDYLYTQKVFLPFDVKARQSVQHELITTVEGATAKGYKIRVAIIGSAYDLGAVPSLWKKPTTYARFLGAELAFVYKQRLLIVMPNGFGFYWRGHQTAHAYSVLRGLKIGSGPDGLVDAARNAVLRLAADSGVRVEAKSPSSNGNRNRVIAIAAAVALIVAAPLGRLALRRRR